MSELLRLDAVAQADLIRRREIQPVDLVDAAVARIEALNLLLNAVISTRFEQARAEAAALPDENQPFRGVPLLLKDFMCETAGDLYTEGSQLLRDLFLRSQHDTYLAQKFRAAGFVFLGKTALPEFARSPVTESAAFGITRNPWDVTRTPGGSSGGSAAAVAAGMVALAHGNDGTGSIRIPAACCGLVGLKPSRGRISTGPANSGGLLGNIAEFVLTKSVRDAAQMLDCLAGNMPGDLFTAPPPLKPYRESLHDTPKKLRIGLLTKDIFLQGDVHEECLKAVELTAKLLENMGHSVEESYPPALEGATGLGLALRIISASGMAARIDAWSEKIGRAITAEDVEPGTWEIIEAGRQFSAVQVHAAQQRLLAGVCRAPEWWASGYDLLLTPTMNQPAPPVGADLSEAGKIFGLFSMGFSISGQPAISLPVHRTPEGLPVGIHLVADYGREDLLLSVAARLEEALEWGKWLDELFSRLDNEP